MRPLLPFVDPDTLKYVDDYQNYKPKLIERYGPYCAYCECRIMPVAHVEHRVSKSESPYWADERSNLLLACGACNSRKGTKVTSRNVENYVWPDRENTASLFVYTRDGRVAAVAGPRSAAADNTLEVTVQHADNALKIRDERLVQRIRVWALATRMLRCSAADVVEVARATGCWSVWTTVFEQRTEDVVPALWTGFPGTNLAHCPVTLSVEMLKAQLKTDSGDLPEDLRTDKSEAGRRRSKRLKHGENTPDMEELGHNAVLSNDDAIAHTEALSGSVFADQGNVAGSNHRRQAKRKVITEKKDN